MIECGLNWRVRRVLKPVAVGAAAIHADLLYRTNADDLRGGVVAAVIFDRARHEFLAISARLFSARRWRRSPGPSSHRGAHRSRARARRPAAGRLR